ncbi:MAG: glycosyltransferase [Deltaproteobacteria bacterium]|nr:glycosyltransferase [Deltaproteobacteria bacterium]
MVDEWLGFEGIPRSAEHLIRGMVERADLTIVTSERLRRRYMPMGGNVQLLRHGTDIALFEPVSRGQVVPDERLQRLIGAKIGYYGAIHKLDLHLIRTLAISRPEWHFVFLGPTGGGSQGVPRLGNMPSNVYFLPPCPRSDLPAFLSGLDAFWMPFRIDELTRSMSPIKIFEVLGAGVPIVMSDLEECRAVAGPWGRFAVTADEHGQMLTAEMRGDSPARRLRRAAAVRNCDWEQRFATLCHLIGMEEI